MHERCAGPMHLHLAYRLASRLLDSLILELSSAVDATRVHRSAIEELQELAAEIGANASAEATALGTATSTVRRARC